VTIRSLVSRKFLVGAVLVGGCLPATAIAQAGAQETYSAPRNPYGQPDLQGFWSNQSYTPLERPDDVTKAFYSAEEIADIRSGRAVRESAQTEPGTIPDVHYDFTQFGLDRSQAVMAANARTSLIVDPQNGKLPPRTAEGRRRAEFRRAEREARGGEYDAAENLPLGARCLISGSAGPPMMNAGYNANLHIVQGSDHVMILNEMQHDARSIPLDGRGQPSGSTRQWRGISHGYWEGDTLVVETANFNNKIAFRGSSRQMRVIERFTRVAEDLIEYVFTVEDEATWARPWTAVMPMQRGRGPLFEHACHEGNYGLTNILAGARAEEARAAQEGQQ